MICNISGWQTDNMHNTFCTCTLLRVKYVCPNFPYRLRLLPTTSYQKRVQYCSVRIDESGMTLTHPYHILYLYVYIHTNKQTNKHHTARLVFTLQNKNTNQNYLVYSRSKHHPTSEIKFINQHIFEDTNMVISVNNN